MSGLGDKIKGKAQEAVGAAKEGVGKATGDADTQASCGLRPDAGCKQDSGKKSAAEHRAPLDCCRHSVAAKRPEQAYSPDSSRRRFSSSSL